MSYSQYRQRTEPGKSVLSGMAVPPSSRRKHPTVTSEDEEQVTQDESFTGSINRSNPSTRQPFSSVKRTSRMGRLKTAPVSLII